MVDFLEEKRASQKRRLERGDPIGEPVLEREPDSKVRGERLAEEVAPYVRDLRRRLFGSPEPPFESIEDPQFHEWDNEGFRSDSDDRAVLYGAVRELADATGFQWRIARDWVLFGALPKLPRAVLNAGDRKLEMPDGSMFRRRYVTLTLHAPISEEDLVRIFRESLLPVWDSALAVEGLGEGDPDKSWRDRHLQKIKEQNPDAGWGEIRRLWKETPPDWMTEREWLDTPHEKGRVSKSALKARYSRMNGGE